jgi:sterol-4alpha-carboxylate 3-dehydrogenase (decarboxylating)
MDTEVITGPVLVVGGCGFLGYHIVNEVSEQVAGNPDIVVIDLNIERNQHASASYYSVDITQRGQVTKIFEHVRPQVVFHTVSSHPFLSSPSLMEKVNVVGTQNLVDAANAVGTVRAFVYTSSSSVVHNHRQPLVQATEDLPVLFSPDQPAFYSHTKALAETIVLSANRERAMLTGSIRPASLYGPRCKLMTKDLIGAVRKGRANFRFGTGVYLFDNAYVENCAYAQLLLARALVKATASPSLPAETRVEGEAFVISNDEPMPFWDIQRLIADIAGVPIKDEDIRRIPVWLILTIAFLVEWTYWMVFLGRKEPKLKMWGVRLITMERTFSIDKAKKRLGYKPKFSNREGWEKAWEWNSRDCESSGGDK